MRHPFIQKVVFHSVQSIQLKFCFLLQPPAPEPVQEVPKPPVPAEHKVLQDIFDNLIHSCLAKANNAVSYLPVLSVTETYLPWPLLFSSGF